MRNLAVVLLLFAYCLMTGMYLASVYSRVTGTYEREIARLAGNVENFLNGRMQALRVLADQPEIAGLDPAEVRPRLVKFSSTFGLNNVALYDREGVFVTSVDIDHPRLVSDPDTFRRALQGEMIISDRIIRRGFANPFISLRLPVYDAGGTAAGVIAACIASADFSPLLSGGVAGADLTLVLLDGNHSLIFAEQLAALLPHEAKIQSYAAGTIARGYNSVFATCPLGHGVELFLFTPVRNTEWRLVGTIPLSALLITVFSQALAGIAAISLICLCLSLLGFTWLQQKKHKTELENQRIEALAGINQLAAGIAHEIRNPLTSLKGFLQYALNKPDHTLTTDHITLMLDEIDRIEQLTNEFRLLTQPQKALPMAKTNVDATVKNIITLLSGQAQAKCVAIDYIAGDESPYVNGNAHLLKQLWLNLLRNALDAVPAGGKIEVTLSRKKEFCAVSVKDNGSGIPPEKLRLLGTPFYTTKEHGTGLGLSVSYNIVHKHRGRLEFASKPGEGTTATVILPLVQVTD
ncbi:MAG: ATP-binding protein [Negativicutes bacterium]|nr:ATP-binding protein [Negativicutes bacterium]